MPKGLTAQIDASTWAAPPVFRLIQNAGQVSDDEMYDVFNMGIGFDGNGVERGRFVSTARDSGFGGDWGGGEGRRTGTGDHIVSMRAVISVSDKTGLGPFARALAEQGVDIYSTGGTKKAIAEAGAPVKSISELTGFPEILGRSGQDAAPVGPTAGYWLGETCRTT